MTTRNTQDEDIEPIIKFVATAGVSQYPFGFRIFGVDDIHVYLNDRLQTSGYSVLLTEGIRGGIIEFATEPAAGTLITVLAEVPFVRDSDFNEAGAFRARVVNKELDIVMALLRQLRNNFSLSAHLPPYYKGLNLELPVPDAGKTILWNAAGDGFVNSKDKIDDLYVDTKEQADIAVAKAIVATQQAEIATQQAAAAKASADAAAITVTGFDEHAAGKQQDFDLNAIDKTTLFNQNAESKTNAFNLNAAAKQALVDQSADKAAASAAAAEQTLQSAVTTINDAKSTAIAGFDENAAAKTGEYNSNHTQKLAAYNQNAAEKKENIDNTVVIVQQLRDETKQFRDDAEAIANLPEATETVKGVSSVATAEEATAGENDRKFITPAKLKPLLAAHSENKANPHNVTKSQIGLANVDNTSDIDKPLSSAMAEALAAKQNTITGAASSIAASDLTAARVVISDASGKIAVSDITSDQLEDLPNKATPEDIKNYQPEITTLTQTSGVIALEINKVYSLTLDGATTFSLPAPANTSIFNQIKAMMKVTGTPTIVWGTDQFFNKATPEIEAGNYDVYFDYDNDLSKWVVGAMAKGVAS